MLENGTKLYLWTTYAFVAAQSVTRGYEGSTTVEPEPMFTIAPFFFLIIDGGTAFVTQVYDLSCSLQVHFYNNFYKLQINLMKESSIRVSQACTINQQTYIQTIYCFLHFLYYFLSLNFLHVYDHKLDLNIMSISYFL